MLAEKVVDRFETLYSISAAALASLHESQHNLTTIRVDGNTDMAPRMTLQDSFNEYSGRYGGLQNVVSLQIYLG